MRADMSKVIVERPRLGSRANNDDKGETRRRQKAREDEDLWPGRQSTARGRRANRKHLNEHLAPLRRFLNARVGKHWSKVYGEIRQNINPSNAQQMHIMQHLVSSFGYVTTNVKAWPDGTFTDSKGEEMRGGWFVNPKTGCLAKNEHSWIHGRNYRRRFEERPKYVKVEGKYFREIEGIWYEFEFARAPLAEKDSRGRGVSIDEAYLRSGIAYQRLRNTRPEPAVFDVYLNRYPTFDELADAHGYGADGGFIYATSKRQLGSGQIKRYKLRAVEAGIPASQRRR
jgi:hypothetical protein